jgi:membrane protein DedA with SNARE-associated domain
MTAWLLAVVGGLGYPGLFLLLMAARAVPPLPTESVVPVAGMAAAHHPSVLLAVALVGGLGSAAGELLWFLPSRRLGQERLTRFLQRHRRWLTLSPRTVARSLRWFERHGGWAVLAAQPVPALRTVIAIPAGACGMGTGRFLLASVAGSALWTGVLAGAGYLVADGWPDLMGPLSWGVTVAFCAPLVLYAWRVATEPRATRQSA